MSHMVTLAVKITNVSSLEQAAKTLGFKKVPHTGFTAYFSKGQAYFGICEKKDGSFEFKSDEYYFKKLNELKQEYAKEQALFLARSRGLSVKSCFKNDNGEYQIELLNN